MSNTILKETQSAQNSFFSIYKEKLEHLATNGQHPKALFIGCSDSRVTPERLLGLDPGDMFMLRNIANIIPPYVQTEIGIVSVLEYAVLSLQVPHIIVCGHTDCGGIRSLDQHIDMATVPALSRWLDLARPAQRDIDFTLRDLTPEERHLAIVERNVINQLKNIESYPFIQQSLAANKLTLHGWVYHLQPQQITYYNSAQNHFISSTNLDFEPKNEKTTN
ncbi:MAG: carbonic anhydrase [Chloroflexi bacterium]|nr:MAG: carbonic anhydrase [Chloroflexota bacterium]